MIKLIDLLKENKEYKIELKNGKSMTKYLSDIDYNKLVANMKLSTGTVKSVEPTGKSVEIEPESKPKDDIRDDSTRRPLLISQPTMMDIIFKEEIFSKNFKSKISSGIFGHLGSAEVTPEKISDYLRKRDPGNYILPSEEHLFTNAYKRFKRDSDAVDSLAHDIADVIIHGKEKLTSSDSDIKTYMKYWESEHNPYRKSNLYNDYVKLLKTRMNPFK